MAHVQTPRPVSVLVSVVSLLCPPSLSVWRTCGRLVSCWSSTDRRWLSLMENMKTCCRCWRNTEAALRSRWDIADEKTVMFCVV